MSKAPIKDFTEVELGFIEKVPSWKLRSKFFPSKVGGFPAWLALKNLPTSDDLSCRKCWKPMAFLCQSYAPIHEKDNCFHRVIFVFICRNPSCSTMNDADNIRVYRCQLKRDNEFYSNEPSTVEEKGSESPGAQDFNNLCQVCGSLGSKVCGGCKKARYCVRAHQELDWKAGHKTICKSTDDSKKSVSQSTTFLFPEYLLDQEPEEAEDMDSKSDEQLYKEYEELLKGGAQHMMQDTKIDDGDEERDLAKMAARETDKTFAKFRTRCKDYPSQVLRYDFGGTPLWVSSHNQPQNIPPCMKCGGPRVFELQVMPQLLVHLKVDSTGNSIDWGTLLVYTCKDSCDPDKAYVEEKIYRQDYEAVSEELSSRMAASSGIGDL